MKKIILAFCFALVLSPAYSIDVCLETYGFLSEDKPYLESHIRILGASVRFQSLDDQSDLKQAKVEVIQIIYSGNSIVGYEKYILNSPATVINKDFVDIRRFALDPGYYTIHVEIKDLLEENESITLEREIELSTKPSTLSLSNVMLLASVSKADSSNLLAKNGLYMEPLAFGVVPDDISVLHIYAELYNPGVADSYYIRYAIYNDFYSDLQSDIALEKYKKLEQEEVVPILVNLPVDELPSGNYHLLVEVFDKNKIVLLNRKVNFVRSNVQYDKIFWASYNQEDDYSFVTNMNEDSVIYCLKAISALVFEPRKSVLDFVIKEGSLMAKKKFLFDHWRTEAPNNPESTFKSFMKVADAINVEFNSNFGYGFETDRGYIFLRYGKPNNIIEIDTEPDAPPYEIWFYNFVKETNQSNVKFLFYNPSLAGNDFKLLHSTCRGELNNPAWEVELYRDAPNSQVGSTVDATTVTDNWGRNARRYFDGN